MREERFVAIEAGQLSALGGHTSFDDAAAHAAHAATRSGTPYAVIRVVGEVRLVKQVQVDRFEEADDAHA